MENQVLRKGSCDMVVVLFAEGFEETEAFTPADILRRAGLDVVLAGVGNREVTGSHKIKAVMDAKVSELDPEKVEALVLPGGLPGTLNLEGSQAVQRLLDSCVSRGKIVGAICAAPSILAHKGLLNGRKATAFPKFQKDLTDGGAELSEEYVCRDGNYITGRGMGVAVQFGLKLVETLVSREKAEEIRSSIQWEE